MEILMPQLCPHLFKSHLFDECLILVIQMPIMPALNPGVFPLLFLLNKSLCFFVPQSHISAQNSIIRRKSEGDTSTVDAGLIISGMSRNRLGPIGMTDIDEENPPLQRNYLFGNISETNLTCRNGNHLGYVDFYSMDSSVVKQLGKFVERELSGQSVNGKLGNFFRAKRGDTIVAVVQHLVGATRQEFDNFNTVYNVQNMIVSLQEAASVLYVSNGGTT
uniref:Uncharacterized protein n=1 Tax=Parascaris equorum TaxID=6256 RepID=A0A914RMW6_PAREQ